MRLIYLLLAMANLRWSTSELERSELLYRQGDEAFARSEARLDLSDAQVRAASRYR